ncbi:amino acid adenylation domain-containing protein [Rivularia sp. IAM M-261]|nr:amino acid adenylation domain-containing protein [Rivularia sp. IAM M-261]
MFTLNDTLYDEVTQNYSTSLQQCVHKYFEVQVNKTPDSVAVVLELEFLTYRELNEQANQLAHYLRSLGVKAGVMVGICVERSLEMVVAILGVLKAGGAYVPIDPNYPSERLSFILKDTQTPILLTLSNLLPKLPALSTNLVCLDSQWDTISQHSQENLVCDTNIDDLIYVIYTSGSTGKPKGVMVPHRGIVNQLHWRQSTFGLTAKDKVLQNISFSFDPSVWQIFWPLCFGGQLVLPRVGGHQDSAYLVKLIAEQQITITAFVPSMLRVILEEKGIEACSHLRHISCGGEALTMELIEQFFARLGLDGVLHNVYGPTEASIDATFWKCQRNVSTSVAPIGKPILNASVYILDENLQPTLPGEAGELYIGGVGLANGYLNRPELTSEKFIINPFGADSKERLYKTGDLARYLPDGNIEFLGRIDHQVKIRGFRIELGEIETTLLQLPNIRETVVIARHEEGREKHLVAYIVLEKGQTITKSEIRNYLTSKLAEYMVPSSFVILEALPLNANGKVDRNALPAPLHTREELEKFVAPESTVEIQLASIWQELLGIESIGILDNFFELGGTSLLATQMLIKIENKLAKKLPLATFLKAATIEELANVIQKETPEIWSAIVPIQPHGKKAPLFCVHGADVNVLVFQNFVEYLDSEQPVYALQPQRPNGEQDYLNRIEDIATEYIKHIRTVQPTGPYYLAGYSIGGVIIFEMAQQLVAQGQEVKLLAFFDTACPIYFQHQSVDKFFAHHWGILKTLKSKEKLAYLVSGLQERWNKIIQPLVPKVTMEYLVPKNPEYERLFYTLVGAVRNYKPQIYPGKITLFRCLEQEWWIKNDRGLGWSDFTEKPIEVVDIPGSHNYSVRTNAKHTAQKLRPYLN